MVRSPDLLILHLSVVFRITEASVSDVQLGGLCESCRAGSHSFPIFKTGGMFVSGQSQDLPFLLGTVPLDFPFCN